METVGGRTCTTLDRKTPGKQANCEGKPGSGRGQLGERADLGFRRQ